MDADGDEEDGDEAEEDDGVDEDEDAARLHVHELNRPLVSRQLKQQPWRQQHEQHHPYHHRPPIRHLQSMNLVQNLINRDPFKLRPLRMCIY
ncbi:hypothetical protein CDL15_Pgr014405 [Punica granatum]|uniref:Uncharacterized protein n=1 Tax=Punica granatum TaxID=22663 RepID=A0A218WF87_PUNGR|nr:hypothetical protein CDL15_Pgr014405 [Punica granatum]